MLLMHINKYTVLWMIYYYEYQIQSHCKINNDLLTQAKQREHLKICIKVCSVIDNNLQLLFSATDKKMAYSHHLHESSEIWLCMYIYITWNRGKNWDQSHPWHK